MAKSDSAVDGQQHIEQLIRQLGSPRYTLRRAAANDLRQIGAEAFDQLYGAIDDADPEIAASARYLLQQIPIRWTESDDPPLVRQVMRAYDDRAEEERLPHVAALARLPDGQGLAALCRIARFDRSPLVSRMAALAVIRSDHANNSSGAVHPEVVPRELGGSMRIASQWLRQWLVQRRDPADSVVGWQRLVDEEMGRLARHDDQTSSEVVLGLLWNMVNLYHELGQPQPMMETVDRMAVLEVDDPQQTTVALLQWFVDHRSWEALDQFIAKYQQRLDHAKRPLYIAALARAQQGKSQAAQELAARASELDSLEPFGSVRMALELYVRGHFDWSVREYQNALKGRLDSSLDVMPARVYLADMLHDHQRDRQAAEALGPLVAEIEKKGDVSQLYERVRQFAVRSEEWTLPALPERKSITARFHYYLACDAAQQRDWATQRRELQLAINADDTDADVVIAMYHVPEADDAWRRETRERIERLSQMFQEQIDQAPNEPIAYNQWAWLVSNTEGDYQKAVQYSRRSLELLPGTPSFLDTLGRCCFAAGQLEDAVKYQRQAIEKMPYMQVMQRQLATFERALAKRGARNEERGASEGE